MQVLDEAYSNFVNSINSDQTRQVYEYTLSQFLKHYQMDLDSFLKLSQQDISNYITNYLVSEKISRPDEPGVLMCPQCGTSYLPKDTISEERFAPSATPKTQTRIITPKKKKKYCDKQVNEINDEQLLKDMARGANVIRYHEDKHGKEYHDVRK